MIRVYASCSLNYLPKARVLADSLRATSPGVEIVLCLCDRIEGFVDPSEEPFDAIWTPAELGYDEGWIFAHNVIELCTAVKGRALRRLLSMPGTACVVYLDPDCVAYAPIERLVAMLGDASIGLVPHILVPEDTETGVELTELSVLAHGTYNLGHLIIRNDAIGRSFADWWAARLDKYCLDDKRRGLFTDQRWADLIPALFEGVRILRSPAIDVASWNANGRNFTFRLSGGRPGFNVGDEELLTYHFSGTGPSGTHRFVRSRLVPDDPVVAEIEREYEARIAARGQAVFERIPFQFDFFEDGTRVSPLARQLYRDYADLRAAFPSPYWVRRGACYREWLLVNRPDVLLRSSPRGEALGRAVGELFASDFYLARYPDAASAITAGRFRNALDHYCQVGSALFYNPHPLFRTLHYAHQVRDLAEAPDPISDPIGRTWLWHYLNVGLPAGFEPLPHFSTAFYLEQNADVARAINLGQVGTALGHYGTFGVYEGRAPGPAFRADVVLESDSRIRTLLDEGLARSAHEARVRLDEGEFIANAPR